MKHSKSAKTSSKSPQTTIQKVDASLHLAYWNDVIAKYAPRILLGLIAAGFILRVLILDALSLWVDD